MHLPFRDGLLFCFPLLNLTEIVAISVWLYKLRDVDMISSTHGAFISYRSRLGCQICLKKFMNNMTVRVPEAVADARQSLDMSKNS